jgi:hypothetical protein
VAKIVGIMFSVGVALNISHTPIITHRGTRLLGFSQTTRGQKLGAVEATLKTMLVILKLFIRWFPMPTYLTSSRVVGGEEVSEVARELGPDYIWHPTRGEDVGHGLVMLVLVSGSHALCSLLSAR